MRIYQQKMIMIAIAMSLLIASISITNTYAITDSSNKDELSSTAQRSTDNSVYSSETAYFNNKASGEYIKSEDSTASVSAGLLSVLGTSIKWIVTYHEGEDYDYYTIRSASDPTLYLMASSATASGRLFLKTIDEATHVTMYQWDIRIVLGGGVIIQSYRNDKCLTYSGYTLVARNLPASTEDSYAAFVWRQLDVTYYGDTSSYEKRELTAGYLMNTCYLFNGETVSPQLRQVNNGAILISPFDFAYSGFDTTKLSYNTVKGEFTALTSSFYSALVTATHKPTGRTATFTLVVNPKAVTVGIPDTGHDHESALSTIIPNLEDCGYSSIVTSFNECESGHIENYLDINTYNLFVSRSHGGVHINSSGIAIDSYLLLTKSSSSTKNYFYASDMPSDLSNMKLAMFVGCETAKSLQLMGARNLPSAAVYSGAETAVGFTANIPCDIANAWIIDFFDLLEQGYSIQEACEELDDNIDYQNTTMTSWKIYGNNSTKIN